MQEIQVSVRGYGIAVNNPAETIINSLESAGYHVIVDNPYSSKEIELKENAENKPVAKVKVIHVPWPG